MMNCSNEQAQAIVLRSGKELNPPKTNFQLNSPSHNDEEPKVHNTKEDVSSVPHDKEELNVKEKSSNKETVLNPYVPPIPFPERLVKHK